MSTQQPTATSSTDNTGYGTKYRVEMTIPKSMAVTAFLVFDQGGVNCSLRMASGLHHALKQDEPFVDVEVYYNTSAYKTHLLERLSQGAENWTLSADQEDELDTFSDLIDQL